MIGYYENVILYNVDLVNLLNTKSAQAIYVLNIKDYKYIKK